jgi:glycosyltransferase involved in cell wall biosynthesis
MTNKLPRIGFVLEQALGHVAYGMALKRALSSRTDFEPVWLDVPFGLDGFGKVPLVGKNWTLRGSLRARQLVLAEREPLDALFVNTQTVSLFLGGVARKIPTMLSLDATPINYDELAEWYGDSVQSASVEKLKLSIHRNVMKQMSAFTTWSEWAKKSLVQDYGVAAEKVVVLPPGTTLGNYPSPGAKDFWDGSRPLRILFVGGDFRRKGGDLLLKVHEHFAGKVELHLVTAAELPPRPGVFVYHGVKPHSPELLKLYRESDVFALPTRGDCLAVVLGEAMASQLPIITTRVGAHAEAVVDGQSGFVIDKDDIEALYDRVARLLAAPDLVRTMSERSRAFGEERFDMQKNADTIGDLLVQMARHSPGPVSG